MSVLLDALDRCARASEALAAEVAALVRRRRVLRAYHDPWTEFVDRLHLARN